MRSVMLLLLVAAPAAIAQVVPRQPQTPPPPATKLEAAFDPTAGTLTTLGYDDLGTIPGQVTVEVREVRAPKGVLARGLLVRVRESQYSVDNAFVDADELPELLNGLDAILAIKENPTPFQNFETSYTTRGKLELSAYSSGRGSIRYAIQAGRVTTSTVVNVHTDYMLRFRAMIVAAQEKIGTLPP